MNLAFDLRFPVLTTQEKILHEKALVKSANFKKSHTELLEIIMEVDKSRLFEKFCLTSTFSYCTQLLKLSEDVTYTLIKISRVSEKVPEVKAAIDEGVLSISNAKRIAAIVTEENKTEWIEKAKELSQKKLDQELAKAFPKEAVKEKISYVSEDRLKLVAGLSEKAKSWLLEAQDILSQKSKASATIEETLETALQEYIERNSRVKKAERAEDRRRKKEKCVAKAEPSKLPVSRRGAERPCAEQQKVLSANQRTPIPAEVIHQINLRDQRKCQARMSNGNPCGSTRWLEYHHKMPVQHGGTNAIDNLTTLCSRHHQLHHSADHRPKHQS